MATYISDYFGVDVEVFEEYGALNISIVNDLSLFIDPFLLFHSDKPEYVELHEAIINYLVFLRDRAAAGSVNDGDLRNWYCFKEVKQNWLGFSVSGNGGAGLGMDFARNLHANLNVIFSNFGEEQITESSHLEKVCLVSDGVGRDNISDFTTNLIKDFLCKYTETFAAAHLPPGAVREVWVERARFNYQTQAWARAKYKLPWINGDYVILTPQDMLTRDENWINKGDLIDGFENVPTAIPDVQLRASVFNYFETELKRRPKQPGKKQREPTKEERAKAAVATMRRFPEIIDYYIRLKEQSGDDASDVSAEKVLATEYMFIEQLRALQALLGADTKFYEIGKSTYEEAHARLDYLKDVIENKVTGRLLPRRFRLDASDDFFVVDEAVEEVVPGFRRTARIGKHLPQLIDAIVGQCGDCLIVTVYDADDTSIGQIVGIADDRLQEFPVFAEHFGDMVDGEDMGDGGHQAASAQMIATGAQFHGSSSSRRLIL